MLSTWLRKTGRRLPLLFVIAGSEVSFFREEILVGQLYGRRTGQLSLRPFSHVDGALFVPGYSPQDKVRTYAVCGGMPYYLATFVDSRPLEENILYRGGLLHEEAELLLRQELSDPLNYFSVLEAVARGATRTSQIASKTGLWRPAGQPDPTHPRAPRPGRAAPPRDRRPGIHQDLLGHPRFDGFLNFHFRFVEPFRSRLRTRADAERHLQATVLPQLDHFVSKPGWELICQQHMLRAEAARSVGAWWGQVRVAARRTEEREVDAVAVDVDGRVTALASCKWTSAPLERGEDTFLTRMEQHIPGAESVQRHYLYSRGGFDEGLQRLAEADPDRYKLLTPGDLFA